MHAKRFGIVLLLWQQRKGPRLHNSRFGVFSCAQSSNRKICENLSTTSHWCLDWNRHWQICTRKAIAIIVVTGEVVHLFVEHYKKLERISHCAHVNFAVSRFTCLCSSTCNMNVNNSEMHLSSLLKCLDSYNGLHAGLHSNFILTLYYLTDSISAISDKPM